MGGIAIHKAPARRHNKAELLASGYRILAFAIGSAQMLIVTPDSIGSPFVLFAGVALYTVVKTFYPFDQNLSRLTGHLVLGLDVIVCILIVLLSAGIHSPFLLYTLIPVVTSALFLNSRTTIAVALLSGLYVAICSWLDNETLTTTLALSNLFVYLIAAGLAAILPYVTNVNVRRQMQYKDIIQERQRLSREIHDGAVQTTSALRWQIQLLSNRLSSMGIDLKELIELEKLAEKAHHDTRQSLENLRDYKSDGRFLRRLEEYLEHFKDDTNINFRLETNDVELRVSPEIELELLRLCQEAIINIGKHSRARTIHVIVNRVNNSLKLSINDDGCGFDVVSFLRNESQSKAFGLAVMRERAQLVGGEFKVLSTPGQGTKIQVDLPIKLWEM